MRMGDAKLMNDIPPTYAEFETVNSSDPAAVAYNSNSQKVRCKSPPTLVDNFKNGSLSLG